MSSSVGCSAGQLGFVLREPLQVDAAGEVRRGPPFACCVFPSSLVFGRRKAKTDWEVVNDASLGRKRWTTNSSGSGVHADTICVRLLGLAGLSGRLSVCQAEFCTYVSFL